MAAEPAGHGFRALIQRIRRMLAPITPRERDEAASDLVIEEEVSAESRAAAREAIGRSEQDRDPAQWT